MATATALVTLETPELAALPPSKAEQIRSTFGAMADMLQGFDADYDAIVAQRVRLEAEREQERAAAEAERRRLEALEAQERIRLALERADAEERAAAEAEAAAAPVRARLVSWVDSFELPDLPGEDHEAADAIREKFAAFRRWARSAAQQAREPLEAGRS